MTAPLAVTATSVSIPKLASNAPARSSCRIAVATPALGKYSESFIAAHIERLPAAGVLTGRPISVDGNRRWNLADYLQTRPLRLFGRLVGRDLGYLHRERGVARWLRANGIDVALAEYGPVGTEIVGPCRRARCPLVVHFRGHDAYSTATIRHWGDRYPDVFGYASAIVVVSQAMISRLIELGAPSDKLHVIPSGTDTSMFSAIDPSLNPPNFLSVGRFVEKKAPQLTLLAFARVAPAYPQATLTMVGDGVLREPCREIAKALGLEDRVFFPGVLSHEQVRDRMSVARAFVQHSITPENGDAEGTPGSVREASATGLPVISTRHAGIPEAVIDGITGLLVEERDVVGMACCMRQVLDDPELARTLGRAGRMHISEHYELDKQVRALRYVLESVVRT